MLNKRSSRKLVSEINIVPYIDVMLVLLVIFIVTAPLLQQGVAVDLPQASAKTLEPADKEPIVTSVDSDGNYYLNIADAPSDPIDQQALVIRVAAVLEKEPQRKVLVKADQNVNYGKVMAAMVLLQQAGAPSVGLVTQNSKEVASSNKARTATGGHSENKRQG
jgi:biopolymer transport protein TolR